MGRSRRDFLKKSVGLVSLSAVAPQLWVRDALAQGNGPSAVGRVLVVLQLGGGNDGMNTVVPYAQGAYYDARPTIGIAPADVVDLDGSVGLHPAMGPLVPLWEAGNMGVVLGAGYPEPNRSHFRSMDIWQTAVPVEVETTGWLGRYADLHLADEGELAAVNIGGSLPKSFNADRVVVPSVASLEAYQLLTDAAYPGDRTNQVNAYLATNTRAGAKGDEKALATTAVSAYTGSSELQTAAGGYTPRATYPNTRLGRDMNFAAQIVAAGVGSRVVYVSTGGYDTHADQPNRQQSLLADMSASVAAFLADLDGQGLGDRVSILAFSEFGRRVEENGSNGTDHGTAGPMFLFGAGITGGIYGEYPSLTSLDSNGDLVYTVDFRSVYADALERWLEVDSGEVLEGTFTPLGAYAKHSVPRSRGIPKG
jgi:uncharacterized protein (DUF1501 family)